MPFSVTVLPRKEESRTYEKVVSWDLEDGYLILTFTKETIVAIRKPWHFVVKEEKRKKK